MSIIHNYTRNHDGNNNNNNHNSSINYIALFSDGVRRTNGANARKYNLLAAKLIAEMVKDMLGPGGSEKMFIDILEETTVTKDGATFLRKIDVEHPAAKVLIEASNAVDNAVGDGTTSVVVLAGALIEKAEELLDLGFSPATICEGYQEALKIALGILSSISKISKNSDRQIMERLATTCLRSKAIVYSSLKVGEENLAAKLIVDAVQQIADFDNKKIEADDIKIEEKPGNPGSMQLVRGIVIDKTIDISSMPRYIKNARILLLEDGDLEAKSTKTEAQITISLPQQYRSFADGQVAGIIHKVKRIIESGANVVISRSGISLLARTHLAEAGIMSIRRVKENDLMWLEKATGGKIIRSLDDDVVFSAQNVLGYAEQVCEKFVGDDKIVYFEGCKNPKAVTLLLRAGSKRMLDEYHRSVLDAINVLKDYIEIPSIVAGGGSTEVIIASELRKRSVKFTGRQQIVIQKFADALEEIPLTIAKNAGMNILDTLVQLRSKNVLPIHDRSRYPSKGTEDDDSDNNNDDNSSCARTFATSSNPKRKNSSKNNYGHTDNYNFNNTRSNCKIVNGKWFGVDASQRNVDEMFSLGIIEPSIVKEQIIKTAVEVTNMLIRVDDVLMAKPTLDTHAHSHSHSHADGTSHSHEGGHKAHDHYFDLLGRHQRPMHHYY